MSNAKKLRKYLKGYTEKYCGILSDQRKGVAQPPIQKPYDNEADLVDLPDPGKTKVLKKDITACMRDRESRRTFTDEPITVGELSYLLWATQGVKEVSKGNYFTKRTVPSAGARHPFETYLAVNNVEGLEQGIYRYLALEHKLLPLHILEDMEKSLAEANCGQVFCGTAPVIFAWSAIPYRTEWRYDIAAPKAILIDAGHVCQNLYLACEALKLGTCAIGAYLQDYIDAIFGVDGKDEIIVYIAPVGKPAK